MDEMNKDNENCLICIKLPFDSDEIIVESCYYTTPIGRPRLYEISYEKDSVCIYCKQHDIDVHASKIKLLDSLISEKRHQISKTIYQIRKLERLREKVIGESFGNGLWEIYCKNLSDDSFFRHRCSKCKTNAPLTKHGREHFPNKCPNCEVKMSGVEEGELDKE